MSRALPRVTKQERDKGDGSPDGGPVPGGSRVHVLERCGRGDLPASEGALPFGMAQSRYYADSRSPRYSILFAFPLLIAYEVVARLMSPDQEGVRNGADVVFKSLFLWLGGPRAVLGFEVALVGIGGFLVYRDWRRHPGGLRASVFAGMVAESTVLAMLVGVVLGRMTSALVHYLMVPSGTALDTPTKLMISLGAGIYEELLFRVVVVGALVLLCTRVLRWSPRVSGVIACTVGALLFSAFHYVGPYGDQLQLASFVFRFLAGLAFSALYLTRGFGVTAWTHALYDIFVTLGGG